MSTITQIFKKYRRTLVFTLGLGLALAGVGGTVMGGGQKAFAAQDCDNNAIIRCGFNGTAADLVRIINSGNSGNGHSDMAAVYAAYNLLPSDYARFVSYAKPGVAYKDGRIVVENQVVGTAGRSIGRIAANQGPGYFAQSIGGQTYYGNTNDKAFAASSIPVAALFNSQGVLQFAVLTSCGNPLGYTPVTPGYACNTLQATKQSQTTYQFSASVAANNNASINRCVYDFGDGTTSTQTNCAATVSHTYSKAGSYTAKVTVYVNLPGGQQAIITPAGQCLKQIQITIPAYKCIQLTGAILDKSKYSYSFTATAQYSGGAQPKTATFNFGDGNTVSNIAVNADGKTFTAQHAYAQGGTYNASATLYFAVPGQSQLAATQQKCPAVVTPETVTPECKPGVPVNSPECTPCEYNSTLPKDSPECVPPELPNTGAGNVIAITAIVIIGGFLGYRHILYRKHKAAFEQAVIGTSPLPLADPLNDAAPLTGTPLARKLKSLRRKRPF